MQVKNMKRKSGQTMVEYIIIVVIIAVAAIAIFGLFGDTIRRKLGGAIDEMGGDSSELVDTDSEEFFKDLGNDN